MDASITPGELLLLLGIFAGPIYLLAAALQMRWLKRHGSRRRLLAATVAIVLAAPLTMAVWWGIGQLPFGIAIPMPSAFALLGFFFFVGIPAIIASAIAFPAVALIAARLSRPSV